jgi:hypothetical protein
MLQYAEQMCMMGKKGTDMKVAFWKTEEEMG